MLIAQSCSRQNRIHDEGLYPLVQDDDEVLLGLPVQGGGGLQEGLVAVGSACCESSLPLRSYGEDASGSVALTLGPGG